MQKRNAVTLCVLSLVFLAQVFVSDVSADFGTSGWTIFKKVQSPQFKAISAAAPDHTDISSVLYNPAAADAVQRRELFFLSETGSDAEKLGCVLFGQPVRNGMFVLGFAYYDAGSIELNWMEDGKLQTRNACAQRDMLGIVAFEHRIAHGLSGGIALKGASSEIAETRTAYAYAADAGLFYRPAKNWSLSAAVQNAGVSTRFVEKENPLPLAYYAGSSCSIGSARSYVMPAVGFTYYANDERSIAEAGIEMGYDAFALNAGYRCGTQESMLHFGLQLRLPSATLGYALIPGTYLDSTHRINLTYKF